MIAYRQLTTIAEFKRTEDLQIIVWQMSERGCVPYSTLRASSHTGGVVVGAFDGEELVGFTWGFPARREGKSILWSDIAGVHPGYQGQGIGFGVKQAQRIWALENGYDFIGWTYDPLQRGNANFNLHRLAAASHVYLPDFYGLMDDELNANMPSDRLEIAWDLRSSRVQAAAEGSVSPICTQYPEADFLLYGDANGQPVIREPLTFSADWHFVEIPYSILAVKQAGIEQAEAWRSALSQVLQRAFAEGYTAVDFAAEAGRCWYILSR